MPINRKRNQKRALTSLLLDCHSQYPRLNIATLRLNQKYVLLAEALGFCRRTNNESGIHANKFIRPISPNIVIKSLFVCDKVVSCFVFHRDQFYLILWYSRALYDIQHLTFCSFIESPFTIPVFNERAYLSMVLM